MLNSIPLNIFGITGFIFPFIIFIGVGFTHMFLGFTLSAKKYNISYSEIEKIHYIMVASILVGFFFAAISSQIFIKTESIPLTTITVMPGFLAGVLFLILMIKIYKLNVIKWLNFLVPYWCFAHGWGRIGCFFGGCCHGKPTDSVLGVGFPPGSIPFIEYGPQNIHPTQLYESFILFLTGFVLLKCNDYYKFKIFIFLIVYGTSRFLIEFFRGDLRGEIVNLSYLSPSQFFSIIFITMGLSYLLILRKHKKNEFN